MARTSILAAALAIALAGCAHASAGSAAVEPAPSAIAGLPSLAGHWQGAAWETGANLVQGAASIDLGLADDGTWSGTIGRASASGTARMQKGRLLLTGTALAPDGRHAVVYCSLGGDSSRRWGVTVMSFSRRPTHAQVSLRKMSN